MLTSIGKLILGAILRFIWDRAEEWYQEELRYQKNRKVLIEAVEGVAREAAKQNEAIAIDRESIDDSLMRLERIVVKREAESNLGDSLSIGRPVFGEAFRDGIRANSAGDQGQLSAVPVSDSGSNPDDQESERPGVE